MQWLMLQQEKPEDYVISTGRQKSIREFVELVAKNLNWNTKENSTGIIWEGKGIDEVGRREDNNQIVIRIDSRYFRPTEVDTLLGDSSKANEKLGWTPKIELDQLVKEMVEIDLQDSKKELFLKKQGI